MHARVVSLHVAAVGFRRPKRSALPAVGGATEHDRRDRLAVESRQAEGGRRPQEGPLSPDRQAQA